MLADFPPNIMTRVKSLDDFRFSIYISLVTLLIHNLHEVYLKLSCISKTSSYYVS